MGARKMRKILLLNGPNLNMLGTREPEVYGRDTLATLEHTVRMYAEQHGAELTCFQSNSEAKLIGRIHEAPGKFDGIVYNPGAHTHYSYALRDAVGSIDVPVVEVHLSAIEEREAFRHVSVIAPACVAQVKGLGVGGYCRAVDVLLEHDELPRLGEGYETRFETAQHILIAGKESAQQPVGSAGFAGSAGSAIPQPTAQDAPASAEPDTVSAPAPAAMAANAPEPVADPALTTAAEAPAAATETAVSLPLVEGATGQDNPAETQEFAQPVLQETYQPARAATPVESRTRDLTIAFRPQIDAVDLGMLSFERQSLVRNACKQLGISALLVRDTPNIRWLTAFDGVFDEERAHALLVSAERSVLHTDSRYAHAIRTAATAINSDIHINDARASHASFALETLTPGEHSPFDGRLGIEDTITYAEFVKAVDAFSTKGLAPTTDVVLGLRAVKDASEIARMRAAQAITDAAFEHIVSFVTPGMTERDVQLELDSFMLRHGADGLAFGTIVASGENGADPHAIPTNKRLQAGQCVVMDFGARAFGYCSDMTRVVFLGAPDEKMAHAWDVLRRANETVAQMLRPGVTGKEAHDTAERVLAEGGFGGKMGHGLGHGVGLECHELPALNVRNTAPLTEGNVVTVEPGIYLPGEFGMRLEDCGVITASGYSAFSKIGHDMVII